MELRTKYLNKLKSEQILGVFYTDNYDESDYGFVIAFNEDFVLIEKYDDNYCYDGITLLFQHHITRIRWSGNDLQSASKIIDATKRPFHIITIDLTSIQTILETISKQHRFITVHTQDLDRDICYIGEIHEMDNDDIVLHEWGTPSSLDRKFILLSLHEITRIEADGIYENNLKTLFIR